MIKSNFIFLLIAVFLFMGCSPSNNANSVAPTLSSKSVTSPPPPALNGFWMTACHPSTDLGASGGNIIESLDIYSNGGFGNVILGFLPTDVNCSGQKQSAFVLGANYSVGAWILGN